MFIREYGDKNNPLIVFIHGGGVSGWMWEKQVSYFKEEYHCLVPDLPEHGNSVGDLSFSMVQTANELNILVEAKANGREIILVGFSLGAQLIIQMLSMRPKLVDKAIINSALTHPMNYMKAFIKPMIHLTYPLTRLRVFSKLQAKELYIDQEYFEQYYEETCNISKHTLIRVLEENMSFTVPETFQHVTANMLITVGEKEKGIMKKSAKAMNHMNKNTEVIVIPNIGHGVSLAKPNYFNKLLEDWLEDK